MTKKEIKESIYLQKGSLRTARLGFVFIAIYVTTNLIFAAWKLLTPTVLTTRWIIAIVALTINTVLWWYSRTPKLRPNYYKGIILLQVIMYIAIATYSIYSQRGMASNAIILYTIPLAIVAVSYSGRALIVTSFLCAISYAGAAIKYFKDFPSEGYKVELYGEIFFYVAIMFLLTALLWVLVQSRNARKA